MNESIITKKVSELGANFPIGIKDGALLNKFFELNELTTDIEMEYGRFKKENKDATETKEVSKLLSLLFKQIGSEPHASILCRDDLEGQARLIEEGKDLFKIGSMYVADVYYAYLYARLEELGHDHEVRFGCQNCGHITDITIDLGTMDVNCIDDVNKLTISVPLTFGFKSTSGRNIKKVSVSPILWRQLETKEFYSCEGDDTLLKLYFISECTSYEDIIDKKKNVLPLNKQQVGSLKKIDREKIAQAVSQLNLGPAFSIEGKCPNCDAKFMYSVDWRYDNFFAISSL